MGSDHFIVACANLTYLIWKSALMKCFRQRECLLAVSIAYHIEIFSINFMKMPLIGSGLECSVTIGPRGDQNDSNLQVTSVKSLNFGVDVVNTWN